MAKYKLTNFVNEDVKEGEFKFKPTETDAPGMQARPDGYLKEEDKVNEGETKNLGGFQYFTDKNEWLEKVKELYPDYEKWMTSDKDGIKLTKGSGMGAVNLGGWNENPLFIYTDDRTGVKYPGTVNLNNKLSSRDLIYPAGSRMDEKEMEESLDYLHLMKVRAGIIK